MPQEDKPTCQVVYLDGDDEEAYTYLPRPGRARVVYPNGDIYEGSFNEQRQKEGQGKYTYALGQDAGDDDDTPQTVYDGEFKAGKRNGIGTMMYSNGSSYSGEWVDGVRHGDGVMKYANGDSFSGQFCQNKKNGKGTYLFAASNAQLKGEWEYGEVVYGRFTHSDGAYYEGYFVDNVFTGEGVHVLKRNGLVQQGEFVGNMGVKDRNISWVGEEPLPLHQFTKAKNSRVQYAMALEQAESIIAKKYQRFDVESKYAASTDDLIHLTRHVVDTVDLGTKLSKGVIKASLEEDLINTFRNRRDPMDVDEFCAWFETATLGLVNPKRRFEDLQR